MESDSTANTANGEIAGGGSFDMNAAKALGMDTFCIPEISQSGEQAHQSLGNVVRGGANKMAPLGEYYHPQLGMAVGLAFWVGPLSVRSDRAFCIGSADGCSSGTAAPKSSEMAFW